MRAAIQRVREASVTLEDGAVTGAIGQGLLVLLGVTASDTPAHARGMAAKIAKLRIFRDAAEKMNLSLLDVKGSALVVSQFTLYADCANGNRPSFTGAARPEQANELYELFCKELARLDVPVEKGSFGAHMDVRLLNDGPVTIWLDSADLKMG